MLTVPLTFSVLAVGLSAALIAPVLPSPARAPSAAALAVPAPASAQLSYRLQLDGRDSTGQYHWSGSINGATHGQAAVLLTFANGQPAHPGLAPVQTRWLVRASPDAESFEATLNGTIDMSSGRTHLVGVITAGADRGRRVETNSQLFNLGEHAALSESSGTMSIAAAPPAWARTRATRLPSAATTAPGR